MYQSNIFLPFSHCQSHATDESDEEESENDNKQNSLSDGERMNALLIYYASINFSMNIL